jgi:predicted O-linked N-acetylglucosamine transferase (SPINDLY family)
VGKLSDESLAARIRSDRIDILFDLGGHTGGNQLLVFARKPAPIQVKWVGYTGSSGLMAMDYLLADPYQVEAGGEANYPEKVLRLADDYICFDPPAEASEVGNLPALARRYVTFGSFNNPAKINPGVVAAWAKILRRVPESRLMLKYPGLDQPGTRGYYEGLFSAEGIAPDRLELLCWSRRAAMLAEYNRTDLVLDPFPYSGGITTCEALWMGVPVITWPGKTFAGRHSLSHLTNAGLTETVARDLPNYIELAVRLAHDLPRLAKWCAELRRTRGSLALVRRTAFCG